MTAAFDMGFYRDSHANKSGKQHINQWISVIFIYWYRGAAFL